MSALHVVEAADQPTAEIYTVTPAVAKRWLSRNVRNRKIRQRVVDSYARDMAAGNWQVTGEAIKFDTNGALADGQHRLSAVVKAGEPVPMLIVRGIQPEAQGVMDSGAKRSAADALTLAGEKNATIVAAVARLALREPAAGFVKSDERVISPTHSEIADFIADNAQIHRAAEMVAHFYPAFDAPPSVLGVCWMRFALIDLEATAEFFQSVANMTTNGPGDPRLALIRRLANARRNKETLTQSEVMGLIFKSWNAWRKGQQITKFLTTSRNGVAQIPTRLH